MSNNTWDSVSSFIFWTWTAPKSLWVLADKQQVSKWQTQPKLFDMQKFIIYIELGAANHV